MRSEWGLTLNNWCEILAGQIRYWSHGVAVYSNLDPSREWAGAPMIELSTREISQQNFLSGDYQTTHALSALMRCESESVASATVDELVTIIDKSLEALRSRGQIAGFTLEQSGVTPDARGVVSGESFYGYVDFTLTEKIRTL